MEKEKLERIGVLVRKSKAEGLSPEEQAEQHALRQEYLAEIRRNLQSTLENTYVVDEKGNKKKLSKNPGKKPDTLA